MAYSGQTTVIQFQGPGSLIAVGDSLLDISGGSADMGVLIVPIPLMLYQFGMFCTETGAASLTGSVFLERAEKAAGSDVTVVEVDLDATDPSSGGDGTAAITASTGAEDIVAGDMLFAKSSAFPYLITAPQVLTCRLVTTAVAGEYVPFVVGRWLGLDYRSTATWAS